LRDVRRFERLGFLDIDWKDYSFARHLNAARSTNPILTVARDIENIDNLRQTLDEARELRRYANDVIIVPKDPRLGDTWTR
jgi:predicted aminopeptidase